MMRLSPPYSPPYGVGQRVPRRGSLADVDVVGTYVPLPRALRALAPENPYRTNCPPSGTHPCFLTTDRVRASAGCRVHAKDEAKTTTYCEHGRPGALHCPDCQPATERVGMPANLRTQLRALRGEP